MVIHPLLVSPQPKSDKIFGEDAIAQFGAIDNLRLIRPWHSTRLMAQRSAPY
jgi:hypothetical protein